MTIRVFISGQSNALGRGTGGPSWDGITDSVQVWNNVNPLSYNGDAFVSATVAHQSGTFENTDRNNFGVWFCDHLARAANDDVRMTIVARGASPIEYWDPSETEFPMLQDCIDVWQATGQPPADIFLWHQGEGNASWSYSQYSTAFLALVNNLTAAGVIDAETVIIVGGLAEDGDSAKIAFNNNVLKPLAADNPQIFYAYSTGLTTYDGGTHFDGDSLYAFGHDRYFSAYEEAVGPFPVPALLASPTILGLTMLAIDVFAPTDASGNLRSVVNHDAQVWGTEIESKLAGVNSTTGTTNNGSWVRFENGLQLCWNRLIISYSSASTMSVTWTFPKPFSSSPHVIHMPNLSANLVNFGNDKRGGSWTNINAVSTLSANLRISSNDLFTGGDESVGTDAFAVGFWK